VFLESGKCIGERSGIRLEAVQPETAVLKYTHVYPD
jgi:hypothetical protein